MKVGDKVVVRREEFRRGAVNKITGPSARGLYKIYYPRPAKRPTTVTRWGLDTIFGKGEDE